MLNSKPADGTMGDRQQVEMPAESQAKIAIG
jgi:hypothetical protein